MNLDQLLRSLAEYPADCVVETRPRTNSQVATLSWGENQEHGLFLYENKPATVTEDAP